jgi:hypothetical protein
MTTTFDTEIDGLEVSLDVEYHIKKGRPGVRGGPPDGWRQEEPDEVVIESVSLNGEEIELPDDLLLEIEEHCQNEEYDDEPDPDRAYDEGRGWSSFITNPICGGYGSAT